jgi:DNA repair protein RecN (Recombination protein N)
VSAAETAYEAAAHRLTQARKTAAVTLDQAVMAELAPLKMDRAVFATRVTTATTDSAEGRDVVAFEVAPNPGAPSGPLAKIASGGELSRFLLALKVCLSEADGGRTIIFDEIDRGIGGATADAVGRRLVRLSKNAQVLIVTHSPQVAALGDAHFQVVKSINSKNTLTEVTKLQGDAKIEEIARMISGDKITPAAINAAATLVDGR